MSDNRDEKLREKARVVVRQTVGHDSEFRCRIVLAALRDVERETVEKCLTIAARSFISSHDYYMVEKAIRVAFPPDQAREPKA